MQRIINTVSLYFRVVWLFLRWFAYALFSAKPSSKPEGEKRGFLLANELPPNANGGTYRPLSWLMFNDQCGWELMGFARKDLEEPTQAGLSLLDKLSSKSDICYYHEDFKHPTSWAYTPRIDGPASALLDLVDKAVEQATKRPPNVIIASGPNFDNFVAGGFLVAKYHLPLILDFRDEWSLCPFDFVKKNRFNNQIERICIKTASRVIFTTEHHKQNYALLYPKYASKFSVIANGWEASDFEPDVLNRAPKVVSTEPVIAHVGALSFHTDPYSFICCFNTLAEHLRSIIKIKFVGKVALRYKQLAKKEPVKFSQIELMGQVPKSAVANVLDDSSMLLLLSNEGLQHYIPGKLYDYLVSGKPILVYGVYSESSRIVESLNAGIHVNENDSEGLYNAIEKILLDPLAFYNNERVDWIRSRTREELAKQFFNTLEDIT